jgi:hypothetical protein
MTEENPERAPALWSTCSNYHVHISEEAGHAETKTTSNIA